MTCLLFFPSTSGDTMVICCTYRFVLGAGKDDRINQSLECVQVAALYVHTVGFRFPTTKPQTLSEAFFDKEKCLGKCCASMHDDCRRASGVLQNVSGYFGPG